MPYRRKDSKNWWISWYDSTGRQACRSSGTSNYRDAKALEEKIKTEVTLRRGEAIVDRTLGEVFLAYLKAQPNTRAAYAVKAITNHFSSERTLRSIRPDEIAAYKAARGVSAGTLNRELGVFRAAVRYCRRELGWEVPNPTRGRIPASPPGRVRWLRHDEAARLVAVAGESNKAPYLADLILVALHTGMRRREILELTWSRVDIESSIVYLGPVDQKVKRHSSVPLNGIARDALLRRKAYRAEKCPKSTWVFTLTGGRIGSVKSSFAGACRRAEIEDFHFHDLRHTCAAWLVQSGVRLRTVAEILRHKSISTTMRYAHLAPEDALSGVSALERSCKRSPNTDTGVYCSPFPASLTTDKVATN